MFRTSSGQVGLTCFFSLMLAVNNPLVMENMVYYYSPCLRVGDCEPSDHSGKIQADAVRRSAELDSGASGPAPSRLTSTLSGEAGAGTSGAPATPLPLSRQALRLCVGAKRFKSCECVMSRL